jgi:hypothetical protein
VEVWNHVAMLRHVWNLFAQAGSLWLAWVEENWLKGKSFWQVSIPQSCSWSWKKILMIRDLERDFIRFKVGNESRIFMWYYNWHPAGCLLDTYGFRAIYDAGCYAGAKLFFIIRDQYWFWPYARSDTLVEIQSRIPEIDIGDKDLPIWKSRNGVYSCSGTWELLRVNQLVVYWWKVVWFSLSIPFHSFLLWLVIKDALVTKEKMSKWGYAGDSLCLFCRGK